MTAEEYYQLGNDYRRQGNYQAAANAYLEAISLDPDSPAVHAKQMIDDIMNYYNKDAYNP
ncbi:MAG: tetratricopeptide repeat protein [Prevotella sp.]|nr:tetratricopeptide repeat protein [Prevotella sp.]